MSQHHPEAVARLHSLIADTDRLTDTISATESRDAGELTCRRHAAALLEEAHAMMLAHPFHALQQTTRALSWLRAIVVNCKRPGEDEVIRILGGLRDVRAVLGVPRDVQTSRPSLH
jgi:hypothetical protein